MIKHFAYGEINEQSFSKLHPRLQTDDYKVMYIFNEISSTAGDSQSPNDKFRKSQRNFEKFHGIPCVDIKLIYLGIVQGNSHIRDYGTCFGHLIRVPSKKQIH